MSTVHQVQSAGAKKKLRQCHRCHQQIQPGYPYQYLRRERRTLYFCHSHPARLSDTLTGDERDLRFQVEQLQDRLGQATAASMTRSALDDCAITIRDLAAAARVKPAGKTRPGVDWPRWQEWADTLSDHAERAPYTTLDPDEQNGQEYLSDEDAQENMALQQADRARTGQWQEEAMELADQAPPANGTETWNRG